MPTLQPRHAANFYPHSPCGERPDTIRKTQRPYVFLSTLSLRRATVAAGTVCRQMQGISIHTLLAESDPSWATRARAAQLFLSTLSLRRATIMRELLLRYQEFLSTLSLRRATHPGQPVRGLPSISIHTLLAESDILGNVVAGLLMLFLSTLSLRRATAIQHPKINKLNDFYPHSPCGERHKKKKTTRQIKHFYPHSPCGERQ